MGKRHWANISKHWVRSISFWGHAGPLLFHEPSSCKKHPSQTWEHNNGSYRGRLGLSSWPTRRQLPTIIRFIKRSRRSQPTNHLTNSILSLLLLLYIHTHTLFLWRGEWEQKVQYAIHGAHAHPRTHNVETEQQVGPTTLLHFASCPTFLWIRHTRISMERWQMCECMSTWMQDFPGTMDNAATLQFVILTKALWFEEYDHVFIGFQKTKAGINRFFLREIHQQIFRVLKLNWARELHCF